MNNKIEPQYVNFTTAKLLKEKRFKNHTNCYYFEDGEFRQYVIQDTHSYYGEPYKVELEELYWNWNDNFIQKKNGDKCFGCSKENGYFETFSAPEQWEVIEWLKVNHGINVLPIESYTYPDEIKNRWKYQIINKQEKDKDIFNKKFFIESDYEFQLPQEAYSAAFDYVLNNLI
jgi:hypothetical protein